MGREGTPGMWPCLLIARRSQPHRRNCQWDGRVPMAKCVHHATRLFVACVE